VPVFFAGFLRNWLGVPPCWRAYFFLLRQEKVAKKKATPGSAPTLGRLFFAYISFGEAKESKSPLKGETTG
jgi:hypothetical protein